MTHTLTNEGHDASEDGTGRGTPIAAITIRGGATGFHMTQDPISSEEQVPCIGSKSMGNGVMQEQALYSIMPMNSGKDYKARQVDVAQPLMTSPVGGNQGGDYVVEPSHTVVRRLTPLECERLQGYPDGWTDNGQADSARYRQLGNSVAVPCVQWIAERLIAVDSEVTG